MGNKPTPKHMRVRPSRRALKISRTIKELNDWYCLMVHLLSKLLEGPSWLCIKASCYLPWSTRVNGWWSWPKLWIRWNPTLYPNGRAAIDDEMMISVWFWARIFYHGIRKTPTIPLVFPKRRATETTRHVLLFCRQALIRTEENW